jgi:hypothetical protein
MPAEPVVKRTVAFVDGQNLFYAAKAAFGHEHPSYDVKALAEAVCAQRSWKLEQVRFYTGGPRVSDDPFWNHFWTAKLAQMGRQGVHTFSRRLRYRNQTVRLPNGETHIFMVGQEKGVDMRLALDVIGLAYRNAAAVIAGVLAHVKENADGTRFPAQMPRVPRRSRH